MDHQQPAKEATYPGGKHIVVEFRHVTTDADIAAVARLADRIWNEHYEPIIGQQQVDYMLENFQSKEAIADQVAGDFEYYLLCRDGEEVGYLAVVAKPDHAKMKLSKIYVRDDLRGEGLGREMMEFAEDLCRQWGYEALWLTCNKHNKNSLAFYKHMGFQNTGPVVQDIGEGYVMDDYRMEKAVDGG